MLEVGDSLALKIKASPIYHELLRLNYESSNPEILSVNGETAIAEGNGAAIVTANATYNGIQYTAEAPIDVGDLSYLVESARTATDISLTRIPESIEVGEEFSAQAYIMSGVTEAHPYPYGYADDNLVKFSSSNIAVCRVKNGVLLGVSTGTATITVSDLSETVQKTFTVNVVEQTSLQYTEAEVLRVNAADYNWTDAETTTLNIQNILSEASAAGMKKVIFPNQVYYVSPAYGSIYIPTHMIVDFSGGIIQIEPSAMTTSGGYVMIYLQDVEYSSLENAIIYGERDLIEGTGVESCQSVVICGKSFKSGLKNCTVSKSPGFNGGFGNTNRKVSGVKLSGIAAGGLDAHGNEIEEPHAFRSAYTNISNIGNAKGQIWLGNAQGYGGYLYMSARVYSVWFYDSDKNFISMTPHCIQYYAVQKPENAAYARIVFWWSEVPTSGDPDYASIAHFHSYDKPDRCYVKNCIMEDNYSLAISTNGGENMLIEGCIFRNNGYRDPASHLDWEDGRQHNKGHILRNCTFEGGGAVTAVGADGLAIHNNIFIDVPLNIGSEVQNSRIWLNQFIGSKAKCTINPKTDEVFSQNYGYDGASYTISQSSDVGFAVREAENNFAS